MAQLVSPGFHPSRGCRFAAGERPPRFPQMLAGVIKIQHFGRALPAVSCHVPNPRCAIAQHQHVFGPPQSAAQSFPMQPPPDLQRFPLPTNDHLPGQQASFHLRSGPPARVGKTPRSSNRAIPRGFSASLASPSPAPLAHLPAVQQQYRQLTRRSFRLCFHWHCFQPLLGLHFRPVPQPLGQRVQCGIPHRAPPICPPPPPLPHTNRWRSP
jgi:hypothetical protein